MAQVSPRSLDLSEAPLLATLQAAPLAAELRGAAVVAAVDRTMAAHELAAGDLSRWGEISLAHSAKGC